MSSNNNASPEIITAARVNRLRLCVSFDDDSFALAISFVSDSVVSESLSKAAADRFRELKKLFVDIAS